MSAISRIRAMWRDPKEKVAVTSALAAVFLVTLKLVVGLLTNSLGILSEALHSGLDLVAALITWFAVVSANKPPDPEHQFGHGKYENLSALVETLLLLITCGWIIKEALHRLMYHRGEVEVTVASFVVMAISIAVDFTRSRALNRAAKKYNSQALEADALHFSSDILSSLVVIAGLIFVKLGWRWGDPLAALGVALLVVVVSLRLGKRTLDNLLDKAPPGKVEELKAAIESQGVHCQRIRIRQAGPYTFVNAVIALDRGIVLEKSHQIAAQVKARLNQIMPGSDIMIHVNPEISPEETLPSKIRLIAELQPRIAGLHRITLRHSNDDLIVDLHLELAPNISVKEAHELVTAFEEKLQRELGIAEVNTHIEPYGPSQQLAEEPLPEARQITEKVQRIARRFERIKNCHDIVVRRTGAELSVNVHCELAADETVAGAHDLTEKFEQALRNAIPALTQVTIHIEPHA